MPERRGFTLPVLARARPRWLAFSLAAHIVLVFALLKAYSGFILGDTARPVMVAVQLPPMTGGRGAPPPAPGRGRQSRPVEVAQADVVAPVSLPTTISAPAAGDSNGVSGGVRGTRGLALVPGHGDPRLWVTPLYLPEGGGRPIDLDSLVRRRMLVMADIMDSLAQNGSDSLAPGRPQYRPPSWTFEHNGRTYGIDQQWIHLGAFKLPTMLLGLIPNLPQGNIDLARNNQRMMDLRADILRAAARSEAEEDFRRAVAQIRERKDRERQEQRRREEQDRQRNRDHDRPIP